MRPAPNGGYAERTFRAQDDVPIYYRDYGDPLSPLTPVLCLTGLTRNSRDFDALARRLAPTRRVLCMDYRGRGKSGNDPDWTNYKPETYANDVIHMLAAVNLHHVVIIGTSLGGLVAMGLGILRPTALAGVVLNDIGPHVAVEGRARIASYVGIDVRMPDWAAAGQHLRRHFGPVFADFDQARWEDYARSTFVEETAGGALRLNYDLRLGDAVRAQASQPTPDLWALYKGLRHIPVLAIRGALSDVLDADTFERMAAEKPDLQRLVIGYRGHVPLLDEPESTDAIDRFLGALR
jgi:pimeloyl-ACP methyl ester carboxylesterase